MEEEGVDKKKKKKKEKRKSGLIMLSNGIA